MIHSAMIFAAGRGTRMLDLTRTRPKPLIEVAGKPLIDHAHALTIDAGIQNTVVNAHYLGDQIASHFNGRNVQISNEPDALLETGGGLKHALPLLGADPVITLNSDAVWTGPNPIKRLMEAWDPDRMEALLMLVSNQNAVGHKGKGDFLMSETGRLTRGPGLTFTGCQIIKTNRIATRPETVFSLNPVWDEMIQEDGVFGICHDGNWCDVGHPEGIKLAEDMLERLNV